MKNKNRIIAFLLVIAVCCSSAVFVACSSKTTVTEYDFSSDGLLDNPLRGFRGEAYIFLGRNTTGFSDDDPVEAFDAEIKSYPETVKIVQQYVYLYDFAAADISETAFNQLKSYFEHVRSCGVKILLRFAYEYQEGGTVGPTTERIVAHCAQIKNWIADNKTLFDDVVYSVQLGMIGLWGEGHNSVNKLDETAVIKAVADMIPEPYTIMTRYLRLIKKIPDDLTSRFAVHEDWLVGERHAYDLYGLFVSDDSVKYVEDFALNKINDGEMPWGRTYGDIAAEGFLKQLDNYSLTTLSLRHCYIEDGADNAYSLQRYKSEYVTKEQLEEYGLPYCENLLEDGRISVYDYIAYHLGYLIVLDSVSVSQKTTTVKLTNYGFATPAYFKLQYVQNGETKDVVVDWSGFSKGNSMEIELGAVGVDGIKLVSALDGKTCARIAGARSYAYGVNVF